MKNFSSVRRVACIFGALLALLSGSVTAQAQQQRVDTSSQRILPLPEGKLSDVQTQMQLLQRLRSLIAASENAEKSETPPPGDSPKIDDKQLQQLQQALKTLQDQLPPGITPPNLDSIPKEQLDEAMSNPAMQEQLKKMLEQFSKDGLLPKSDSDASRSPLPPMPGRPGQQSTRPKEPPSPKQPTQEPPSAQPGKQSPSTPPDEKSWQSLKDAMKKLADIAQGGKENSPEIDQQDAGNTAPINRNKPQRRTPQKRNDRDYTQPPQGQVPPGQTPGDSNGVERQDGEPNDPAAASETTQPSLQAFQDLLERYKNSQNNQPSDGPENDPVPEESPLPEIRPGMRSPRTSNDEGATKSDSSKRVIRRPDRATPFEPPVNSGPRTSDRGEVYPPPEMPSRNIPPSPGNKSLMEKRGERPIENASENRATEDSMPSVSEFLKEHFRNGFPTPTPNDSTQTPKSPAATQRPNPSRWPESDTRRSVQPGSQEMRNGGEQPGVDIRSELQKRGIRGTLEKLIEKAKEDSNAQRQMQQESIARLPEPDLSRPGNDSQNAQTKNPGNSGLAKSLKDLLGGMDDQMEDIVKDAKFKDRSPEPPGSRDSARQPSSRGTESPLHKWNDAASDFLSDLSKAPQAPASPRPSSGGEDSVSADSPLAIGSILLVGFGLLGLVCVFAFFMRRPLLKLGADATGMTSAKRTHGPGEIHSREDVISAFHELALNPKQLVEAWWTHRAAATKIAAGSPQQGDAVRALAEIYEQARYLPDDVELPADRIQSARTAFAECR